MVFATNSLGSKGDPGYDSSMNFLNLAMVQRSSSQGLMKDYKG
jgi:hypothetical protein